MPYTISGSTHTPKPFNLVEIEEGLAEVISACLMISNCEYNLKKVTSLLLKVAEVAFGKLMEEQDVLKSTGLHILGGQCHCLVKLLIETESCI